LAALPLALLIGGAVFAVRRRSGMQDTASAQVKTTGNALVSQMKGTVGKVRPARRKPRNLVRYYSIGMLIMLLERDLTRKVLLTLLKWMQKRV
jgi:hypothetical protein